jgi:hypothetical protein
MSSQVLELIERARSGPQIKTGGADHLGNARSRWSRFMTVLRSHPGRVHCWRENVGAFNHAGVCVMLMRYTVDLGVLEEWQTARLGQGSIDRLPGYLPGLQQHAAPTQPPAGLCETCTKAKEPV